MKILFFKQSSLAMNPEIWAYFINKYTEHDAYVLRWYKHKKNLLSWNNANDNVDIVGYAGKSQKYFNNFMNTFDFIHFNDKFMPFPNYGKKSLMHYHSTPGFRPVHLNFEGYRIANAPHVANEEYPSDVEPIKWLPIDLNSDKYNINSNPDDKIKIVYTPSNKTKSGNGHNRNMHTKGWFETVPLLKRLKNKYPDKMSYVIHHGVDKSIVLRSKAASNIVIDECVTGNYHMSGLEGLAMGKMVIGWLSDNNIKILKQICPNTNIIPYDSVFIPQLESYLEDLIINNNIEYILQKGKQNREWMANNWSLEEVLGSMIKRYEKILC